jgi:hypothetical protein
MIAFHGKDEVKQVYVKRVQAHRAADELRQGFGYWKKDDKGKFRGCAVGCTLHSGIHGDYETKLGVPRILARLEDVIFERLPNDRAMAWPEEFLTTIPVGADLSLVWPKFAVWLLADPADGVIRFARSEKSRAAIQKVADLYLKQIAGEVVALEDWRIARESAYDVAHSSASASDAASSASSAAAYATYAAYATSAAATTYAAYASSSAAAAAAGGASSSAARGKQADKLLELLATAPVVDSAEVVA